MFPQKVKLDEASHTYTHENGDKYIGFSSVFDFIGKPFFRGLSKRVAESEGVENSVVTDRWDAQREEGKLIDRLLTEYCKTGDDALKDYPDYKDGIKAILEHYSYFHSTVEQEIVYSERFRTATAIDKIGIHTNRKDSPFSISDFKCYEKGDIYEHKGWLKAPFDYLPDSKFIKIAFQLSYGAWHLEQLTGKKCKQLFIDLIKPSTVKNSADGKIERQIIYVPYLRSEIELLLTTFSPQILEKVNAQQSFITEL